MMVQSREDEVLESIRLAFDMCDMARGVQAEAVEAARSAGQQLLELKAEELTPRKVSLDDWLRIRLGEGSIAIVKKWTQLPAHTLNARQEVMALGVLPLAPSRPGMGIGGGLHVGAEYLKPLNSLCEYLREVRAGRKSITDQQRADFRELINLLAGL